MEKNFAILLIICFVYVCRLPSDAQTILKYSGGQKTSSPATINYYTNKKEEMKVQKNDIQEVEVGASEKSKYDENGYHIEENEPKKRGASQKKIYNFLPVFYPFNTNNVNSAPVYINNNNASVDKNDSSSKKKIYSYSPIN